MQLEMLIVHIPKNTVLGNGTTQLVYFKASTSCTTDPAPSVEQIILFFFFVNDA